MLRGDRNVALSQRSGDSRFKLPPSTMSPAARACAAATTRANKGKFMGFGHAVYQVEDPRAVHLKELSRRLGIETGDTKLYDISIAMEQAVKASIKKNCNVDFYSASLQHYMGIPGDMFTCGSTPSARSRINRSIEPAELRRWYTPL
mgnify:CR=1 FL=1